MGDALKIPVRRDGQGVAHIIALSGGKDSTAMALKLREDFPDTPFTYVCTPTGDELPEMFAHWRKLADIFGQRIWPLFGGTLKSVNKEEKALPNFRMRFCTRRLKIEPFEAFLGTIEPAVSYVGLRADEMDREGVDYGSIHGGDIRLLDVPRGISTVHYLRVVGWGLKEVWACLDRYGITIPERTDCARCFWQKLGEWYLLWLNHRDVFMDAAQEEIEFGHTYRSPGRDTWPIRLIDLAAEFEKGRIPEISLRMMDKRKGMCRACSL